MNYAKNVPLDKNNVPYATLPAYVSTQAQAGVPVASSVISLSPNSTVIDVTVMGGASANSAILGKWGPSSVTATNFDWIVQSGQFRTFVIPVSVFGAPVNSVAGVRDQNGLYNTVSVKAATAQSASIFTAEF